MKNQVYIFNTNQITVLAPYESEKSKRYTYVDSGSKRNLYGKKVEVPAHAIDNFTKDKHVELSEIEKTHMLSRELEFYTKPSIYIRTADGADGTFRFNSSPEMAEAVHELMKKNRFSKIYAH